MTGSGTGSQQPSSAAFGTLTVNDVMEREVRTAYPWTKADAVATQMLEGFGCVPIVDDAHRLVGLITEHDLLAVLERGRPWEAQTADEIMIHHPYSVRPETDVNTLVHVLRKSDLIRVPVVDGQGRLVGIVARRDLLRAYLGATRKKA